MLHLSCVRLNIDENKNKQVDSDFLKLDKVDLYFKENNVKDELLMAYIKEYKVKGSEGILVKALLQKIFKQQKYKLWLNINGVLQWKRLF